MNLSPEHSQTLAAFTGNPTELLRTLHITQHPITLAVDGQPVAILQTPEAYPRLLDIVAFADEEEALRQGLEDIQAGRTRPASEVFDELREQYNIPR